MNALLIFAFAVSFGFCQKRNLCNWKHDRSNFIIAEGASGVIPVDLRCSKGYLEWRKPTGGLRVTFRAPVEFLGSEFKVHLLSKKDIAIFYEETHNNGLRVLRGFEKHDPKDTITFSSKNGDAGLYLVIRSKDELRNEDVLRIDYELEREQDHSLMQDCSMCNAESIADLFCKGDFAVKAKVQNKYIHKDGENVYLDLHAYHVFHQSTQIFLNVHGKGYHIGRVKMLGRCSPPKGKYNYIFIGRLKPDHTTAQVECYMQFSRWKQVRRQVKCKMPKRIERKRASRDIIDIFYETERCSMT